MRGAEHDDAACHLSLILNERMWGIQRRCPTASQSSRNLSTGFFGHAEFTALLGMLANQPGLEAGSRESSGCRMF